MSGASVLIQDAFAALVKSYAGRPAEDLYSMLIRQGFGAVAARGEPDEESGTLEDLFAIAKTSGQYAVGVPILEANIAALAGTASTPTSHSTVAVVESPKPGDTTAAPPSAISLTNVPWSAVVESVIVLVDSRGPESRGSAGADRTMVATLRAADASVSEFLDIAGDRRADVSFNHSSIKVTPQYPLRDSGASLADVYSLGRSWALIGAAGSVLRLGVAYAQARKQFGRAIGTFQAVQQELAQLAGAVEQATAMCQEAAALSAQGRPMGLAALAAQICAKETAATAVRVGHQIHGAMGITAEYELQRFTLRLMAGREHYGSEVSAMSLLGASVLHEFSDDVWSVVAGDTEGPR